MGKYMFSLDLPEVRFTAPLTPIFIFVTNIKKHANVRFVGQNYSCHLKIGP